MATINLRDSKKLKIDEKEFKTLSSEAPMDVEIERPWENRPPGMHIWYSVEIKEFKERYRNIKTKQFDYKEVEVVEFLMSGMELSNKICEEMRLYHNNSEYMYIDRNGEQRNISKTSGALQEAVTNFYYEIRQSFGWWKTLVSSEVLPFVPKVRENDKYIIFKNGAIDVSQSFIKKEIVWINKDKIDINSYPLRFRDHNYITEDLMTPDHEKAKVIYDKVISNITDKIESEEAKEAWLDKLAKSIAMVMLPVNRYGTINIWKSNPGSGKNVMLNPILELFKNAAHYFDPHNKDEFLWGGAYLKKLIYADELKEETLLQAPALQSAASNAPIPIRMHGTKPFTWNNPNINMLFLTNYRLIASQDAGLWRRLNVVEFSNDQITKDQKYAIDSVLDIVKTTSYVEYFVFKFFNRGFKLLIKEGFEFDKQAQYRAKQDALKDKNIKLDEFIFDYVNGNIYEYVHTIRGTRTNSKKINERPNQAEIYETYRNWTKEIGLKYQIVRNEFITKFDEYLDINHKDYVNKIRNVDNKTKRGYYLPLVKEENEEDIDIFGEDL